MCGRIILERTKSNMRRSDQKWLLPTLLNSTFIHSSRGKERPIRGDLSASFIFSGGQENALKLMDASPALVGGDEKWMYADQRTKEQLPNEFVSWKESIPLSYLKTPFKHQRRREMVKTENAFLFFMPQWIRRRGRNRTSYFDVGQEKKRKNMFIARFKAALTFQSAKRASKSSSLCRGRNCSDKGGSTACIFERAFLVSQNERRWMNQSSPLLPQNQKYTKICPFPFAVEHTKITLQGMITKTAH